MKRLFSIFLVLCCITSYGQTAKTVIETKNGDNYDYALLIKRWYTEANKSNLVNFISGAGGNNALGNIRFSNLDNNAVGKIVWNYNINNRLKYFKIATTDDDDFVIDGYGNVGIGVKTPKGNLNLYSKTEEVKLVFGQSKIEPHNSTLSGESTIIQKRFNPSLGNYRGELTIQCQDYLNGNYYNRNVATFLSNGNVGIGTTSPKDKLSVNGGISVSGLSRGTSNSNWGTLSNKNVYSIISGRYFDGNANSLHGFGVVTAGGIESPFIYGYEYQGNKMMFGGVSHADRNPSTGFNPRMVIDLFNGNVGIGTTLSSNPKNFKLAVNGKIGATEIEVVSQITSDFVFEEDYNLKSLEDVEEFVKENKHLPEIPSAKEFKKQGQNLAKTDDLLLRKIEELTLYVIQISKENKILKKEIEVLKKKVK